MSGDFWYSAKGSYSAGASRSDYERARFSGLLGNHRYRREHDAVRKIVEKLPKGILMLDCPCGNGRWWSLLTLRANKIIGVDVSEGMLGFAREEAKSFAMDIKTMHGDAERLDLPDEGVDFVFSFALTKHLPRPVQYRVLQEFSRVSKLGVICTFGVFSFVTYGIWRRRHLVESYPVLPEELRWMADAAGLTIDQRLKCTTALGVENLVLFRKKV